MSEKERFLELINSINREGKERLISYLEKSDFFIAPASTQFHSSYEGGLLHHSLKVYDKLIQLIVNNNIKFKDVDSPIIIALLHDICKTQYYSVEYRNTKNENGQWVQKPFYKVKDECPIGVHADKSVMMLLQLGLKLTNEEIYCIRYHMGAYESREVMQSLGNAKKKYENIVWVCLADDLASLDEEREMIK